MLVLSRSLDTVIRIGPNIRVRVLSLKKGHVKLGIEAPEAVHIWREEICPAIDLDEPQGNQSHKQTFLERLPR